MSDYQEYLSCLRNAARAAYMRPKDARALLASETYPCASSEYQKARARLHPEYATCSTARANEILQQSKL